jgi:hypothetical protein
MQALSYRNSAGVSVDFNAAAPFVFWRAEGLSLPTVTPVYTQAPAQHGYTLHNLTIEPRVVRVSLHIHGKAPRDSDSLYAVKLKEGIRKMFRLRKDLQSILNPLTAGELFYQNSAGRFVAPCFLKNVDYGNRLENIQTIELRFECPSPFWLDTEISVIRLAYIEGGMKFPVKLPTFFGTMGYRVEIDNDGAVIVPLEFTIDGGSVDPVIENVTTGQFIKLSKQMTEDEQLYINTDPEQLRVQLITVDPVTNRPVYSNAYGYLSEDSELFSLIPGRNEIRFRSADENKKIRIRITFRKRYIGA